MSRPGQSIAPMVSSEFNTFSETRAWFSPGFHPGMDWRRVGGKPLRASRPLPMRMSYGPDQRQVHVLRAKAPQAAAAPRPPGTPPFWVEAPRDEGGLG